MMDYSGDSKTTAMSDPSELVMDFSDDFKTTATHVSPYSTAPQTGNSENSKNSELSEQVMDFSGDFKSTAVLQQQHTSDASELVMDFSAGGEGGVGECAHGTVRVRE